LRRGLRCLHMQRKVAVKEKWYIFYYQLFYSLSQSSPNASPLHEGYDPQHAKESLFPRGIVRAIETYQTYFRSRLPTMAQSKSHQEHPLRFPLRATKRICILSYSCGTTKAVRKRNDNATLRDTKPPPLSPLHLRSYLRHQQVNHTKTQSTETQQTSSHASLLHLRSETRQHRS
jgi:hypothetical protein